MLIRDIKTVLINTTFPKLLTWIVSTLLLAGCASSLPPLPPPAASTPQQVADLPEPGTGSTYTLGAEDVLRITVFGQPDLSLETAISPDGSFLYPLIGKVQAAGLTVPQLEKQMVQRLADGYLVDPRLTITVAKSRSRHVYVMGSVRTPGIYPLRHQATLLELISQAGGPTPDAGWYALVVRSARMRNHTDSGAARDLESRAALRVDLEKLLAGQVTQRIRLDSGDTIYIPKGAYFFVSGQVGRPGRYPLGRDTTVFKAVILAGGFTQFAARSRVKVRRLVEGQPREFRVRMHDLLQAGDVLVVPESAF